MSFRNFVPLGVRAWRSIVDTVTSICSVKPQVRTSTYSKELSEPRVRFKIVRRGLTGLSYYPNCTMHDNLCMHNPWPLQASVARSGSTLHILRYRLNCVEQEECKPFTLSNRAITRSDSTLDVGLEKRKNDMFCVRRRKILAEWSRFVAVKLPDLCGGNARVCRAALRSDNDLKACNRQEVSRGRQRRFSALYQE